jgi:hypothetical protein
MSKRNVALSAPAEIKRLKEAIEANTLLVGNIGMTTLTTTNITATSGQDLTMANATGKDLIVTFSDAVGGRKLIFKDSGGEEIASLDSNGVFTGSIVNTPILNDADADSLKVRGLISTRDAADNSMYVPVANTSGYERGMKIAYAPVVNDGGYFDALYANVKVASDSTPTGIVRALEAKATIEGNMGASAEAHAILAKVNVSGASAEVSKAIGLDVLFEEESSGTITSGTGVRVQSGSGTIGHAIDVSGTYDLGAIKLPYVDGNAAVSIAALESAFGTDDLKDGIIGVYRDDNDADWLITANAAAGKYGKVAITAVTS